MKLHLDTERCQGHGRCYTLAESLFEPDEMGHSILLSPDVPAGREDEAVAAVENCPEQAISLEP